MRLRPQADDPVGALRILSQRDVSTQASKCAPCEDVGAVSLRSAL
jgi:hypothetical protein